MQHSHIRLSLKRKAYAVYQTICRLYWSISGGRRENVFGQQLLLDPHTQFPSFRGLRLPSKELFSTYVRYADYVQTHAAHLFLQSLDHPPVVVDVGAHHGSYAVILGKLVQQMNGKLVAVEPNPPSFMILQNNVRMNDLERTVSCERAAIMDRATTVYGIEGEEQTRMAETIENSAFAVETMTLSGLLDRHHITAVDLLIIDVEGAELNVLRGLDWEKHRVERIFCELHPYNWMHYHYSGRDVSEFLTLHGYRCFDMYFREFKEFPGDAYIGPTFFAPREAV